VRGGIAHGLHRPHELHAHITPLNVGATRQSAEVIFQQVTYGGMPSSSDALDVYARVLGERGEPFLATSDVTALDA